MDQIVIATAGHVDHGKTTLIKALTGTDTDTTDEEKRRGLTINLGFTYFKLPSQQRVGIVDVPGHEKFLKNMIAGLAGVDMVLLVIDANEGVMPQTIEHASILRLLGVKNFIIVFTKIDTVDADMLELAVDDFKETFNYDPVLINAPIVKTDSLSGNGISELISCIERMSLEISSRKKTNFPRMNIDRSFSIKGVGTIVTGTLLEGDVKQDDDLVIYPSEIKAHVRQVRTYDKNTKTALVGQRAAFNINVASKDISRGDVIAQDGSVQLSDEINVSLQTLSLEAGDLELNSRIRFYVGATEVLGRVFPLGTNEVDSHNEYFFQIRLEKTIVVKYGDRFVIRTYSPMRTIAGGKILQVHPRSRKRFDGDTLHTLMIRKDKALSEIINDYCLHNMGVTLDVPTLENEFNESEKVISQAVEELISNGQIVKFNENLLVSDKLHAILKQINQILSNFHKQHSLRSGMSNADLKSNLRNWINPKDAEVVLRYFITTGDLKVQEKYYALPSFNPVLSKSDLKIKETINSNLSQSRMIPSLISDVTDNDSHALEVLETMLNHDVVLLDSDHVMSSSAYKDAVDKVSAFIETQGPLSLADFRDITGSSRKYSMIILEHMDKDGITIRVSNKRILKTGD